MAEDDADLVANAVASRLLACAVPGVGTARRVNAVRWGVSRDIVTAWILTLPAAMLLGAVFALLSARIKL